MMRFKIVQAPETDTLLEQAVSEAMNSLRADFAAAHVSLERQRVYRSIARELLKTIAGQLSQAELTLPLPDELSEEQTGVLIDAVVKNIESLYVQFSATAMEGFRKTVRASFDYTSETAAN